MNPIVHRKKVAILGSLCMAACLWLSFFAWHINGTRVIADERLPDGTHFIVTQKCNWSGEPFTTACYYQKPGSPWGWYYYHHQDGYWNHAPTLVNKENKQLTVFRNDKATVTFNWETETCILWRFKPPRLFVGPQNLKPDGWEPLP